MGGGISSIHHLRKVLVIRAYNNRPESTTVAEQFSYYRKKNGPGGEYYISRQNIEEGEIYDRRSEIRRSDDQTIAYAKKGSEQLDVIHALDIT